MNKKCNHLWIGKNAWTNGWSGQYGTFICSKCLAVCKFQQEHKEAPIEIIEIIESKQINTNCGVKEQKQ